jgi:hypothetical protein
MNVRHQSNNNICFHPKKTKMKTNKTKKKKNFLFLFFFKKLLTMMKQTAMMRMTIKPAKKMNFVLVNRNIVNY